MFLIESFIVIAAVFGVILLGLLLRKRLVKGTLSNILFIFSHIIVCIAVAIVASSFIFILHGATIEMLTTDNPISTANHYNNSPIQDNSTVHELDEKGELDNTVIAFYRFNCPDCTSVYSYESSALEEYCKKNNKDLYWVSTRSEFGNDLAMKYRIKFVPSVLIPDEDNLVINCGESDEDGNMVIYDEFKDYFMG